MKKPLIIIIAIFGVLFGLAAILGVLILEPSAPAQDTQAGQIRTGSKEAQQDETDRVAANDARASETNERIQMLEREEREAQRRVVELRSAVAETSGVSQVAIVEAAEQQKTPSSLEMKFPSFAEFRSKAMTHSYAKGQSRALAERIHHEFLSQTITDPELRDEIRELLAQNLLEISLLDQFAKDRGEFTVQEVQTWIDEERDYLNQLMVEFLPDDALAEWNMDTTELFRQEFLMNAYSMLQQTGLSPEATNITAEIFADEAVVTQAEGIQTNGLYTQENLMLQSLSLFETIRERLRVDLRDDEFAIVNRWLTNRIGQLETNLAHFEQQL